MGTILTDIFNHAYSKETVYDALDDYMKSNWEYVKDVMIYGYMEGERWALETDDVEKYLYAVYCFEPCYLKENVFEVGDDSLNDSWLGEILRSSYDQQELPDLTWLDNKVLADDLPSMYFVYWEFGWHQGVLTVLNYIASHHMKAMQSALPLLKAYRP